jgi:hypothetical protein
MSACLSNGGLRMVELKKIVDSFGETLWTHLADEVEQLGAENMRSYWAINKTDQLRKTIGFSRRVQVTNIRICLYTLKR